MLTPYELKVVCAPIIDAAAEMYNVDRTLIMGKSSRQNIVAARRLAIYACYRMTGASTPQLARVFGKKWHSTILHGIVAIERRCEKSLYFRRQVKSLIHTLLAGGEYTNEWRGMQRFSAERAA